MVDAFTVKDWLIILATLLSPILAVQVQKFLERLRERHARKERLFVDLMTTRSNLFSAQHVNALNMIDIAFYGTRVVGRFRWQTRTEQAVVRAWNEYRDNLNQDVQGATPHQTELWGSRNVDFLVALLHAMADDVGYSFDKVSLKRGAYSPIAHGTLEQQHEDLRKALLSVFKGDQPLKFDVVSLPQQAGAD